MENPVGFKIIQENSTSTLGLGFDAGYTWLLGVGFHSIHIGWKSTIISNIVMILFDNLDINDLISMYKILIQ